MKKSLLISLSFVLLFSLVTPGAQKSYGHIFSPDESASFLALVEQIRVETHLAESTTLATVAQQHAKHAVGLLDSDIVKELKERNNRIGTDLPLALYDLQGLVASSNPDAQTIRQKVDQIDGLLGEAVSVRIEREQLNNATTSALSFAILVNAISEHYGKAIPQDATNATDDFSEPVETTTGSGAYKVRVSWSPPEIVTDRTNTYNLEFFDGRTNQRLKGSVLYAFMFMPASDPDVMIIHRQPEYATDGRDDQSFAFREQHVGPNTLRISWINGFEREVVDFPITVASNNQTAGSPPTSQNNSEQGKGFNMTEYQTAQALAGRLEELFADMKSFAPANSTELAGKIEDGIRALKLAIDQKSPADDVEIVIHGQIHPNLQMLYNLQIIPEFPSPIVIGILALGVVVAARLRISRG